MERKRIAARCAECGEKLTEGDAAYSLLGETICPTCVKQGFIICGGESFSTLPFDELEKIYNIIHTEKKRGGGDRNEQK